MLTKLLLYIFLRETVFGERLFTYFIWKRLYSPFIPTVLFSEYLFFIWSNKIKPHRNVALCPGKNHGHTSLFICIWYLCNKLRQYPYGSIMVSWYQLVETLKSDRVPEIAAIYDPQLPGSAEESRGTRRRPVSVVGLLFFPSTSNLINADRRFDMYTNFGVIICLVGKTCFTEEIRNAINGKK